MPTTVLIVEDDETSRNMLAYLVGKAGYRVVTAGNGLEGIELARREHPELIVMDVQMPVMDGYRAAQELKRDTALRCIPVVAVTAVAMVGDREKVLAAGFDAYITKPIVPEDFVAQVEALLSPDRRASAASGVPDGAVHVATVAPARAMAKGGHILIVDDRADNLKLMGMTLEPSGYRLTLATNSGDAMIAARADPPDLIISDIHLAEDSGYDLFARLRLDDVLSAIPVMLISSSTPAGVMDRRHAELGVADLIVRPIDPDQLLARVAAALAGGA